MNISLKQTNKNLYLHELQNSPVFFFLIVLTHGISNIFNFPCQLRMIVHIQGEKLVHWFNLSAITRVHFIFIILKWVFNWMITQTKLSKPCQNIVANNKSYISNDYLWIIWSLFNLKFPFVRRSLFSLL